MTTHSHEEQHIDSHLYVSGPAALLELIPDYVRSFSSLNRDELTGSLLVALLSSDRLLSVQVLEPCESATGLIEELKLAVERMENDYGPHAQVSYEHLDIVVIYFVETHNSMNQSWLSMLRQAINSLILNSNLSLALLDELEVTPTTWRSLMCDDSDCCPQHGRNLLKPKFFSTTNTRALFTSTASQEEIDSFFSVSSMSDLQITERDLAMGRAHDYIKAGLGVEQSSCTRESMEFRLEIVESIEKTLSTGTSTLNELDWNTAAVVICGLRDIHIRDCVLKRFLDNPILREAAGQYLLGLIPLVSDSNAVVLLTALAGATWLDGYADFAHIAIHRALDLDPSYSLALLLNRALSFGVPSSVWSDSLEAVSQEECLLGAA